MNEMDRDSWQEHSLSSWHTAERQQQSISIRRRA